jgi:UDP-N-acetyl-D-galactosamine dehydrogenase
MGAYVARQAIQRLAARDRSIRHARVGLLGLTFKENIPDIRNSKTVDIFNELRRFSVTPIVHDPLADPEQVQREYTISLSQLAAFSNMDLVILAVAHRAYDDLLADQICGMVAEGGILIDVKGRLNPGQVRNDISYWSL